MPDLIKAIVFALLTGLIIGVGIAYAGKVFDFEVSPWLIGGIVGGVVGATTTASRAKKSKSDKTD